ncbi:MAG: 2-octaprenyl-6-methoxyphenyl hydroxylase [Gammaproteobacteria bacterium]|nr:2-octaprenyl-6-methoxyphenyl hydroxylase [Gammaproteobacteria bacterium]
MKNKFDIIIVGGGMVGAVLASILSRARYRIVLIETYAQIQGEQPGFDDRAIALSWGSSRILNQLGLWSDIRKIAEPIKIIQISDRGHFGTSRIDAQEENVPALGYVVTAGALGKVLMNKLPGQQTDDYRLICPAQLREIKSNADWVDLTVELEPQSIQLQAKLVIAADGTHSIVRTLLGVGCRQHDYQQDAIIANITPQLNHKNTAYERFTGNGPIAMLPMQAFGNTPRCALVWTVPRSRSDALILADETTFLTTLQQQFGFRLGYLQQAGKRSRYPLSLVTADNRSAGRVVFLGNAAQTIHPVAGQGFNLALRDISALLDCLLYPDSVGDPGNNELLQLYVSLRTIDQRRVIRFTDSLIKIFSNDLPLLKQVRAASLSALDCLPSVRRKLVRMSMGLQTPLPRVQG